jgi:hypothetical protein
LTPRRSARAFCVKMPRCNIKILILIGFIDKVAKKLSQGSFSG